MVPLGLCWPTLSNALASPVTTLQSDMEGPGFKRSSQVPQSSYIYYNLYRIKYRTDISRNPTIFPMNRTDSDICILQCEAVLPGINKNKILYH